jgi:type I restriction enzyme S subunit
MDVADKNVPELRFGGYKEEWEKKAIVEVAPLQRGFDLPTSQVVHGNYPIVYSNGILNYHNDYKCDPPGVITGRSGTIGSFTFVEERYWPHNTSLWVTDFMGNVPIFIYYFYQTIEIEKKATGSGVPTLNRNDVLSEIYVIPLEKTEQTAIGNFFRDLDDAIALAKQQHEKTLNIKKAMLEKMFPKKGATVPEVRFGGYVGEWIQHRLGKSKDVRDGTHESPKFILNGYPLVTSKNLSETGLDFSNVSLISKTDFNKFNQRSKVDIGDILFGMIGTIGNPVIIDRVDFAIKNVALIKNCGEVKNGFLLQLLKTSIFENYTQNEYTGSTQTFLGLGKIRDFSILAPKQTEQTAIGNFFKSLDTLIDAQRQELEKLKNIKTACLKKMFV